MTKPTWRFVTRQGSNLLNAEIAIKRSTVASKLLITFWKIIHKKFLLVKNFVYIYIIIKSINYVKTI